MTNTPPSLGDIAEQITDSFANITQFITPGAYLAGIGFAVGAILKLKQHKDNPTQISIGTPIALVTLAGAVLVFPQLLTATEGMTLDLNTGEYDFGGSYQGRIDLSKLQPAPAELEARARAIVSAHAPDMVGSGIPVTVADGTGAHYYFVP